jgi:rRNA maturation RNase YbeY
VSLSIAFEKNYSIENSLAKKLIKAYEFICAEEGIHESSINLMILGDKEITALNSKYRNKKKPTDVLSFTNDDISKTHTNNLGDIAINIEFVRRESKEINKSFESHMIHMLVHGIYHILGFDHENDNMAKTMEDKEIALLSKLKITNPYI